ncbi:MAG TPA: hypothetical protein VLH75_04050 [Longimicrobiales bacterium]|nr:hypothetical protein [Longimicrobiales bacterium]
MASAAITALLLGAWSMAPPRGGVELEAEIGYSVYLLTEDALSSSIIGGTLGGAAAYAGGEAGASVGGLFGGILGAAAGGLLGAL